jgi:hypothetical protein
MTTAATPDDMTPTPRPRPMQAKATIPTRIHTVRFPDPLWDVLAIYADAHKVRDGVSEVIRRQAKAFAVELLREDGVDIADDDDITETHADAYWTAHGRE